MRDSQARPMTGHFAVFRKMFWGYLAFVEYFDIRKVFGISFSTNSVEIEIESKAYIQVVLNTFLEILDEKDAKIAYVYFV